MMIQSDEQNNKAKENIKTAWSEGDLWGLFCAGLDNFMNILFGDSPISFRRFLEDTSISFDKYIKEVSYREHLYYVGGKFTLELEKLEPPKAAVVHLSADFYFQTRDKRWAVKKKTGKIDSSQFSNWDTDPEISKLRNTGKMELSIEPPEAGER